MKRILTVLAILVFLSGGLLAVHKGEHGIDEEAVGKVIVKAYIEGVHMNRDAESMAKGFHPDFIMFVYKKDGILKMTIDEWMDRVEELNEKEPDGPDYDTTYDIEVLDLTGTAAVARIELYRDSKHIYTDYMSLYKFDDGWKIVGKIYYKH